jgi:hypothetical protein
MASIRSKRSFVAVLIAGTSLGSGMAFGQAAQIPPILVTPDKVESSIGTLDFKDGAPSSETTKKVYDTLAFTRGLDAFLNSLPSDGPDPEG